MKLLCEFSKLSKLSAFNLLGYQTNTDASILAYKVLPERTSFNMYAEYTRPQLTFLALVPRLYPSLSNCRFHEVLPEGKKSSVAVQSLSQKLLKESC